MVNATLNGNEKHWLISYWCARHTDQFGECVHKGTLGGWRIAHLEFKDGPYVLMGAHEISKAEYDRLNGWIG